MGITELSARSRAILVAIAEGRSYDQILAADSALTYHDIFWAAGEALEIAERGDTGSTYEQRMAEIRQKHPRAYEAWTEDEEAQLTELHQSGKQPAEIAAQLQRQPGAIRSRLAKLNLLGPSSAS
jgi:DNA-binding NarL/FixJ family response regulator